MYEWTHLYQLMTIQDLKILIPTNNKEWVYLKFISKNFYRLSKSSLHHNGIMNKSITFTCKGISYFYDKNVATRGVGAAQRPLLR